MYLIYTVCHIYTYMFRHLDPKLFTITTEHHFGNLRNELFAHEQQWQLGGCEASIADPLISSTVP